MTDHFTLINDNDNIYIYIFLGHLGRTMIPSPLCDAPCLQETSRHSLEPKVLRLWPSFLWWRPDDSGITGCVTCIWLYLHIKSLNRWRSFAFKSVFDAVWPLSIGLRECEALSLKCSCSICDETVPAGTLRVPDCSVSILIWSNQSQKVWV